MTSSDNLDELVSLVPRLHQLLACQATDACDSQPVSMSQYRAMSFIRNNPGTTLSDVALELDTTLGSTSDLIDRLVALELVDRQTNPHDRREVQLSLTAAALAKIARMRSVRQHQFELVRKSMTGSEWTAFSDGLTQWAGVLEKSTLRKHSKIATQRGAISE